MGFPGGASDKDSVTCLLQETRNLKGSSDQEGGPLEEGMAIQSSILALENHMIDRSEARKHSMSKQSDGTGSNLTHTY